MGQHIPRHQAILLLYAGLNVPSQIPLIAASAGYSSTAPAEYAREDEITAHLLAAELLRIHLHADQSVFGYPCFTSMISVYDDQSVCSAAGLWCCPASFCASGY